MIKTLTICLFTAFIALALNGCATILSGAEQDITFDSGPQGATVTINGISVGQTPLTIPVQRAESAIVLIELADYEAEEFTMVAGMNGMFWGNIIIGGLLGSSTDSASGAIHQYNPGQYFVELRKAGS